jgi:DNA invertase Pin-like site-specific DNA recombinase
MKANNLYKSIANQLTNSTQKFTVKGHPKRAVAYIRNKDLFQLSAIKKYADEHGIEIIREYVDEGPAQITNPELNRMIQDINAGVIKVDSILIFGLERLTRNLIDANRFFDEMRFKGIQPVLVNLQ